MTLIVLLVSIILAGLLLAVRGGVLGKLYCVCGWHVWTDWQCHYADLYYYHYCIYCRREQIY